MTNNSCKTLSCASPPYCHNGCLKDTGYSVFGSGSIVLQLNRTETVEQKYGRVCNDEKV